MERAGSCSCASPACFWDRPLKSPPASASWQAISELKKNPGKIQEFQLNPMGQWLHLIAFGISMLYPAVALPFSCVPLPSACAVQGHVMLINVFLVFKMFLVAATGYVLYRHPPGGQPIPVQEAIMLGASLVCLAPALCWPDRRDARVHLTRSWATCARRSTCAVA